MNTWDHLPNAKHIDRVLEEAFKKNPASWKAAWHAAWHVVRNAAWHAAWHAVAEASRNAAWYAVWNAARDAAGYAARDAVLALIAYDDCAYLLDMPADQVKILALLGMPAAVLLYPACVIFEMETI